MKLDSKFLDDMGIEYTEAVDGQISVGGSLYLRGTQITALPEGLSVGGYLYLRGTQITALPEGLSVGGYLDLEGTQITALPEGLSVGGSLDLRGTQITALPEGLSVGGSLYLRGTQITALPEGLSCEEVLFNGDIDGQKFEIMDGFGCVVLSKKQKDGVTIRHCRKSRFKDGEPAGEVFYVASRAGHNAHGTTIKLAMDELAFKTGSRDVSQWRDMDPETTKTPEEWASVYRMITGACQYGTREFMSRRTLKETYTLAEILAETQGAYGHERFRGVVAPHVTLQQEEARP